MSDHRLTIGRVANQTGCHVETIRYYERERLLPVPERSAGGNRLYDRASIERLVFIRRSRELGFSMKEIRELLSLVDSAQVSCDRVKQLADAHAGEIRARIADLRRMEAILRDLSSRCSGKDVPTCPIIDALQSR
ncbi:MAG: helix-turn-helix domain-containing protein [Pseudomonadales bacterium]